MYNGRRRRGLLKGQIANLGQPSFTGLDFQERFPRFQWLVKNDVTGSLKKNPFASVPVGQMLSDEATQRARKGLEQLAFDDRWS